MNIYLVDFENVKSQGLSGINRLDSNDRIIIFYSENADSMTFELHDQINLSKAYIHFQKVDVGTKNALDFQLATYLGYLICENEQEGKDVAYHIVTKDRGYSSLVVYWSKRGIDITLSGSLLKTKEKASDKDEGKDKAEQKRKDEPKEKEEQKSKTESKSKSDAKEKREKKSKGGKKKKAEAESDASKELRIQVEQVVPDRDVVDLVVHYIQKYKTKLGINNALAKEFKDSKKASEIYKSIKPLIADKKGQ